MNKPEVQSDTLPVPDKANMEKGSTVGEKKAPASDAASRYAALRSHAIRLEEAIDPNAERVDKLRKMDVIFGRGKGLQKHPGNKRMRSIIDRYKVQYHASKRAEKKDLVVTVYNEITEGGVRFLKKIDGENAWILVDEPVAMEKVSHTLRCRKLLKGTIKDEESRSSNKEASLPSSSAASIMSSPAVHPQPGPSLSLTMNRGEMLPGLPATSSHLATSLYGNLGGTPSPSAAALGSLGSLGTFRMGAMGAIGTRPSPLAHLRARSYAGLSGYGGLYPSMIPPPTDLDLDLEYLALLRRRRLEESLLRPQAREVTMLRSARLQLAANDSLGGLTAEEYARLLAREDVEGKSVPYGGGGNTSGMK